MKIVGISSPCRYTAPCADKGKLRSKTKLSNKFLILSPPYKKAPATAGALIRKKKWRGEFEIQKHPDKLGALMLNDFPGGRM